MPDVKPGQHWAEGGSVRSSEGCIKRLRIKGTAGMPVENFVSWHGTSLMAPPVPGTGRVNGVGLSNISPLRDFNKVYIFSMDLLGLETSGFFLARPGYQNDGSIRAALRLKDADNSRIRRRLMSL